MKLTQRSVYVSCALLFLGACGSSTPKKRKMADAAEGEETGEGGAPGMGGKPATTGMGGKPAGTGGMAAGTGGMAAGMGGMAAGMGGMAAGMGGIAAGMGGMMAKPDAGMGGMGMGGMGMGGMVVRPPDGGMGGMMNMAAMLTITPATKDFAMTTVGMESATQDFMVKNTGTASVTVMEALGGTNAADFALGTNDCNKLLIANASCTVQVKFKPTSGGAKAATITVSGGAVMAQATLSGMAVAAPSALTIDPPTHDFGTVERTKLGTPKTFTIKNTGATGTGMLMVVAAGTSALAVPAAMNTCTTLAAAATCTVVVTFNPTDMTGLGAKTGFLTVTPITGSPAMAALMGNVVDVGQGTNKLTLDAATKDAGDSPIGVKKDVSFTITNTGTVASGIPAFTVTGTNMAEFVVGANTCGAPIAPAATCTVTVGFTPTALGARTASLKVAATPGGEVTGALTGNGVAVVVPTLTITPLSRNFGIVRENSANPVLDFVVKNTGAATVGLVVSVVAGSSPAFTLLTAPVSDCQGLALGASTCTVRVQMNTTVVGDKTGTVSVTYTGGPTLTAALTGKVVAMTALVTGVRYRYFELPTALTMIPDFLTGFQKGGFVPGNTFSLDIDSTTPRSNNFAFEFTALLDIVTPGAYLFSTSSDDGSRLSIDGVEVVNNDEAHLVKKVTGPAVDLAVGLHPIKVTYFNGPADVGGGAGQKSLSVTYGSVGAGVAEVAIPAAVLFQPLDGGATVQPAAPVTAGDLDPGLHYKYFEANLTTFPADFNTQTPLAVGGSTTGFDRSPFPITARPAARAENYAFQWNGYILVGVQGAYTFTTESDDGSALYIDGVKVVTDNDGTHAGQSRSGVVTLAMGYHAIRVDYFQAGGGAAGASLGVSWQGPGVATDVAIPLTVLFRPKATPPVPVGTTMVGLAYSYWKDLALTTVDDFPLTGVPTTGFTTMTNGFDLINQTGTVAFEFNGFLDVTMAGNYTFSTNSDDGSIVWVDGQLAVKNDAVRTGPANAVGANALNLAPGKHQIRVRYFHVGTEAAVLDVKYSGPGQPVAATIPAANLVHAQ